jgi:hypothetical protein
MNLQSEAQLHDEEGDPNNEMIAVFWQVVLSLLW